MAEFFEDIVINVSYNLRNWQQLEEREIEKHAAIFRQYDDGDLVGKTFSFQVADGYAQYMVVQQNNGGIGIASIQVGDGYRYDEELLAMADESYIRKKVVSDERWKEIFKKAI